MGLSAHLFTVIKLLFVCIQATRRAVVVREEGGQKSVSSSKLLYWKAIFCIDRVTQKFLRNPHHCSSSTAVDTTSE